MSYYEATEMCPHCMGENVYPMYNPNESGYVVKCKHCGKEILLCDECMHSEDNESQKCDWHETECGGTCFRNATNSKENKFLLFMCCLGNGITVCNKAVIENGDYKMIAHIADSGRIVWYVETESIPGNDLLRIEHHANVMYEVWNKKINNMTKIKAYEYMLDLMPHNEFMHIIKEMNDVSLEEKIEYMKQVYYGGKTK